MGILSSAARTTTGLASATTSAAGAIGGATIGGAVGAIRGGVRGATMGGGEGSQSRPAAVLTFAALGVSGLVEWPVVLVGAGAALVLDGVARARRGPRPDMATAGTVPALSASQPRRGATDRRRAAIAIDAPSAVV